MFIRRTFDFRPLAWMAGLMLALASVGSHANPFVITSAATAGTTGGTTGATTGDDDDNDYGRAERFAQSQFALIRREAAAGGGENLRALASLLDEPDPAAFEAWMQSRYEDLFREPEAGDRLVARIVELRGPAS